MNGKYVDNNKPKKERDQKDYTGDEEWGSGGMGQMTAKVFKGKTAVELATTKIKESINVYLYS